MDIPAGESGWGQHSSGQGSAHSCTCPPHSPGCRVQGPGGAAQMGALQGPRVLREHSRLLPQPADTDPWAQRVVRLATDGQSEPLVGDLGTRYRETCGCSGRRRQVAEPPLELVLAIKPLCPTPLLCPIQRRALLSFLVLQVLVDGREAEKAAEEPHGCLHQVCLGFCPGKRPTSPPASWGPTRFLPLGGCSESPPVIGPAPVQGPCWAVMGVRSLGLTAASRWLVVL